MTCDTPGCQRGSGQGGHDCEGQRSLDRTIQSAADAPCWHWRGKPGPWPGAHEICPACRGEDVGRLPGPDYRPCPCGACIRHRADDYYLRAGDVAAVAASVDAWDRARTDADKLRAAHEADTGGFVGELTDHVTWAAEKVWFEAIWTKRYGRAVRLREAARKLAALKPA